MEQELLLQILTEVKSVRTDLVEVKTEVYENIDERFKEIDVRFIEMNEHFREVYEYLEDLRQIDNVIVGYLEKKNGQLMKEVKKLELLAN